jgi:ribonuclease P protein component
MSSFSFSKKERLLNPGDFVKTNRSGRREQAPHFTVVYAENGQGISRLGITVSRKTGNAVVRNKVKRLVREFFRLHKGDLPQGHDILVAAKRGAGRLDYREVEEELSDFLLDKRFCLPF